MLDEMDAACARGDESSFDLLGYGTEPVAAADPLVEQAPSREYGEGGSTDVDELPGR